MSAERILDTTLDLLATRGLNEITVQLVAETAGFTRPWVYRFFPDIEAIYAELFRKLQPIYFVATRDSPVRGYDGVSSFLKRALRNHLQMPPGLAILTSYAINSGSGESAILGVRERLNDYFTQSWVEPLVAIGNERGLVVALTRVYVSSLCALVVSIDHDQTTPEQAFAVMTAIIDGLVSLLTGVS